MKNIILLLLGIISFFMPPLTVTFLTYYVVFPRQDTFSLVQLAYIFGMIWICINYIVLVIQNTIKKYYKNLDKK